MSSTAGLTLVVVRLWRVKLGRHNDHWGRARSRVSMTARRRQSSGLTVVEGRDDAKVIVVWEVECSERAR